MTVVKDKDKEIVYFVYSEEQERMRTTIEAGVNKTFVPGEVLVHGEWKKFTQLALVPNSAMFADSIIVASGYKQDFNYKDCTSKWKVRTV